MCIMHIFFKYNVLRFFALYYILFDKSFIKLYNFNIMYCEFLYYFIPGGFMEIQRNLYLQKLIACQHDGQIKVITGLRRCGKSFLLFHLFKNYLLENGIADQQIITFELDQMKDIQYRNPIELSKKIHNIVDNTAQQYYLFIDEVQMSDEVNNPYNPKGKKISFYDMLNDLKELSNLDIYVTGSNSKMLSNDILTEFRGRSDEIKIHPFSFSEYYSFVGGDKEEAFDNYSFYGGMPFLLTKQDETSKIEYLENLFKEVYIRDIVERKHIEREDILSSIIDLLCSSVGSLTNPSKITKAINSKQQRSGKDIVYLPTINKYIDFLEDSFLFKEALRFDVKGKSYLDFPKKYYCEDIGLRNARTGFRQIEMPHIMENILYNELIIRGFKIDVGVVYENIKTEKGNYRKVAREIDFIIQKGMKKYYIQSAYAMENEEKVYSESRSLNITGDSFPKIIVRRDIRKRFYDENGILNIGLIDFLLSDNVL